MTVVTFTGANSYLLGAALQQRRAAFVETYGDLAIETIDIVDWSLRSILDTFGALPFLSPKRQLVVYGIAANKQAAEQIQKLLEHIDDSSDVFIVEPKLDRRGILFKTLKKSTELLDFTELDARDLPSWLTKEAKLRGGSISTSDAAFLVARIGAMQQVLSNELDKLLLYEPSISRKTIELLTVQTPQSSIFDLIEAAFSGNLQRAMSLYEDQRSQNVEPLAIEALFVWQLHALAVVKAAGQLTPDAIAAETGLSPYVVRKSAGLAARRTLSDIRHYVKDLLRLEYAIKTTATDADELMKNYILSLAIQ